MLPVVVAYADILVGHWTRSFKVVNSEQPTFGKDSPVQCLHFRSGQNHAIMKKTFWYLLFMVIILPTFGFTSAQAYIDFLIKNNQLNWECIFLPDSGAFFVNYVITSAMIGSGLELIRCVLNLFSDEKLLSKQVSRALLVSHTDLHFS